MKITDYLKEADMTQTAFAEKAGVSDTAVSRSITGNREPGKADAKRIVAATGGVVAFEDLWAEAPAGVSQ